MLGRSRSTPNTRAVNHAPEQGHISTFLFTQLGNDSCIIWYLQTIGILHTYAIQGVVAFMV